MKMKRKMKQSHFLLSLVQGEDGRKWASTRVGWKNEDDDKKVCNWEGIECDKNNLVIAILLSDTNLSGSIPSEIFFLGSLEVINLANNKVFGNIPYPVASLPNLVHVNLSQNRITGTLPHFSSPKLETMHLGHNDLHGSIPRKFMSEVKMTLHDLNLSQNRLSGSIPDSIMELKVVEKIDLSNNMLHGMIPDSIGNLSLIRYLYLNNNFLVGPIPNAMATSHPLGNKMGDLLEVIHLQDNQLSGTLPITLEYLTALKELLVHENKFTGEVPRNICTEDVNPWFFSTVTTKPDQDLCDAISCPSNTVAFDGVAPCISCNNGHFNPYIGQTRMCNTIVNQREILKKFYEQTTVDGNEWNGDNNWEDDEEFLCDFSGVTCDENSHVTEINLSGRGLKGTIPDSIGFLKYLEKLDVSDNQLSGYLPSDLRWAPLQSLDISGNKMKGIIPPKLCLKGGVNHNGLEGDYSCHNIACPVGTYSVTGRQDTRAGLKCIPCRHNNPEVLGMKTCNQTMVSSGVIGVFIAIFTLSISAMTFAIIRTKDKQELMQTRTEHSTSDEEQMREFEMQRPVTGSERTFTESDTTATMAIITEGRTKMKHGPDFALPAPSSPKRKQGRDAYSKLSTDEKLEGGSVMSVSSQSRASRGREMSVSSQSIASRGSVMSVSSRSRASRSSDESSQHRDWWLDVPRIT